MKTILKLFVIPKKRAPQGPPEPPVEIPVEAQSTDALLAQARSHLEEQGYKIRSLSFAPNCVLAYVEEVQ